MSLSYDLGNRGRLAVVYLTGRIDRDAGSVLEQAFTAALAVKPTAVELDFRETEYINSTGIALIVSLLARAMAQRLPMRAAGLSDHYIHIFEITRLSDFIQIVAPAATQ